MIGTMNSDQRAGPGKNELRARVRARRAAVSLAERSRRDRAAVDRLLRTITPPAPGESRAVTAFIGRPGEPGGEGLPDALRDAGFDVWLPVVTGPDRPLHWLPYQGPGHVRRGAFGILEPDETTECPSAISTVELSPLTHTMVVPALAVARDGTRLGQGGGYYDRTLAELPSRTTVIALVDDEEFGIPVPADRTDVPVDLVVTGTVTVTVTDPPPDSYPPLT